MWKVYISMSFFSIIIHSNYKNPVLEKLSQVGNKDFVNRLLSFQPPSKLVIAGLKR